DDSVPWSVSPGDTPAETMRPVGLSFRHILPNAGALHDFPRPSGGQRSARATGPHHQDEPTEEEQGPGDPRHQEESPPEALARPGDVAVERTDDLERARDL